jgi:hypothetical protein
LITFCRSAEYVLEPLNVSELVLLLELELELEELVDAETVTGSMIVANALVTVLIMCSSGPGRKWHPARTAVHGRRV